MGRRRRRINAHLPQGVYRKGASYIYRANGKDTYLCKQKAPTSELWAAYERVSKAGEGSSLRWLVETYLESPKYLSLRERTQEGYKGCAKTLLNYTMANGRPFGSASLEDISQISIRGYLDKYPAPISANRQIQFLKAAWNWAGQRYTIPPNPCTGVELNKQTARTRYVTDEEYRVVRGRAKGYLRVAMELAYLCRARRSEVFAFKTADCLEQGLRLRRGKGSQGEITAWTPRLRRAVAEAKELHRDAPTPVTGAWLIHDKNGRPISKNSFDSAWRRLMAGVDNPFTFHDLKAKGYSDQDEQFAGHKSVKMHSVYNRKLRVVMPPGGK